MKKHSTPETAIKSEIINFLEQSGVKFLRLNSGLVRKGGRHIRLCPSGTSDLLLIRPGGRTVFLEIKVNDKRLDPDQEEFKKSVEDLGHMYCIATSVEDVLDIYRKV